MIAACCEQDLRFLLWATGDSKQALWFACKFAGACGCEEEEEAAAAASSSGHGHGVYPRYRPYTLLHLLHIRNSIR
jgi:NADH pyrophosphatase NudC (nudix superfamily)